MFIVENFANSLFQFDTAINSLGRWFHYEKGCNETKMAHDDRYFFRWILAPLVETKTLIINDAINDILKALNIFKALFNLNIRISSKNFFQDSMDTRPERLKYNSTNL